MWLVLLSLLAINSVQSATSGYPYRSVWNYSPIESGSMHGYLRYVHNNEAGGLVGYNNLQPVYAVRQIKYVNNAGTVPAQETFAINNSETNKARETYLRAASLQQYQNLKSVIEALRAEGKEPSDEKLFKLQMLEKIAFTSDFSLIADLPEIRSILQDLESSVSGINKESVQIFSNLKNFAQNQGEIKTYVGNSNMPLAAIEETPEQKQAREDHLRIYNEQIAHLKQLELEHQKYVQEAALRSNIPQSKNVDAQTIGQIDNVKALAELERAQQDHFRLWNEAKLSAKQAGYESGGAYATADKQQISILTNEQKIYKPKQTSIIIQNTEAQALSDDKKLNDQAKLKNEQVQMAYQKTEQHHIVDTPEVVRAREEHLRIVNEAILRAQTNPKAEQKQLKQQNIKIDFEAEKTNINSESLSPQTPSKGQSQNLKASSLANYRAEQSVVEETPEVKKAREEHLRLVHEANLRAQFVEQQELKYKHESQIPILKSQYGHQELAYYPETTHIVQETPEVVKAREEHLRWVNKAKLKAYKGEQNEKPIVVPSQLQQQQSSEVQITEDTSEVQRARDEHFRIFNSIKSHAVHEQAKQNSRILPLPTAQQQPMLDYSIEEDRLLEVERLREAERLQKEQQLLEQDRLREAERLAEEKRQMEAELMSLKLEEQHRLEMERLLEVKRLQQEQEELQKLKNAEYQEIIIQTDSIDQQPEIMLSASPNVEQARFQQITKIVEQQNQQYLNNPFLKVSQVANEGIYHPLDHSVSPQSSFLKTVPAHIPSNTYQHDSPISNSAAPSGDNTVSGVRYFQSSHSSNIGKYQHIKDNNIKHNYHNAASTQPADTTVALIALEKATNDHFRAHELALEQLRLARIQNPVAKDCN